MEQSPIITLITDFGSRDPFVGIMKGVILNINPLATIIDITHDVTPQNIQEASFAIGASYGYFPHRTIHVVVVDPGVGSARRPLLVTAGLHYFIGPDNGLFSRIYETAEDLSVLHVTADHYFLTRERSTFDGKDVFAPLAGWLSKGIQITKFGDPVDDYTSIPAPVPLKKGEDSIEGEVIFVDHFGNLITNISRNDIGTLTESRPGMKLKISTKGNDVLFTEFYSQAADEGMHAVVNSFGYLELFVNLGSASSIYAIKAGEKVEVTLS